MPKKATQLTRRQVRELGPGQYADGNGLNLLVEVSGSRHWIVRVHVRGQVTASGKPKRRELGIGNTEIIPLDKARQIAIEYQRLAREGIDPKSVGQRVVPSFEAAALSAIEYLKPSWTNAKHAAQWTTTFETYVFPFIGSLPVDQVMRQHVLQCLEPIWTDKHDTAKKVMQRIGKVIDVATAKGHRSGDNPVSVIKSANILPKVTKAVKHHDAMPWAEVPEFFGRLRQESGPAALALQLTILTAARTGETINAQWSEFDLNQRLWTLPPERMKASREHVVPLSETSVAILSQLRESKRCEWVFEGQKAGKPFSNMAMANVLKRMGVTDATVHGFRTSFRTWCGDNGVEREVAELCLAHRIGNAVEQAYSRSDYLERRRDTLARWDAFLAGD